MANELTSRLRFRIKKLEGPGYLMPNCVADLKDALCRIEELEAAICISVREEFTEAEVENDKQAIEWFTGTFEE